MPTQRSSQRSTAEPVASAPRSYLPAERQDMILSLLTRENVVTVPRLAEYLGTTEITVRRDLTTLAEAGLLRRVRGGAMSVGGVKDTAGANQQSAASRTVAHGDDETLTVGEPLLSAETIDQLDRQIEQPIPSVTTNTTPRGKGTIGLMFPEPSFFWPTVIDTIRADAARLGYRTEVRESSYERIRESEILDSFAENSSLRGIIACPSAEEDVSEASWNWISHSPVPVVVAERDQPFAAMTYHDSVRTNHPYGVRMAINHFREHGHRHVGAAFTMTPTSAVIEEAWNQLTGRTNLLECPFVIDGIQPYDTQGVEEIVDKTLETGVTGLLVHSDYLAIALAQALERHGKRVPDDVSLISIDGYATPSSRPLTVLRSPQQEFARECLSSLLWRLDHPDWPTRHIFVDPRLIDRHSVVALDD
ncbi:Periplasmic binding protein-like domain-containing protein [Bifidobacterium margollesii]|uniref:Periplasmic binding protein-like domain-containing protein n=1 Tax=Bifidobacterium margollesii TaxID=2020964 RepID=A0A2N5JCQ5_9BIFI|nr:substrate-binding domain-containing protein [Bifidobacterium margollesii]PLS31992.1 Periplasmic binding protein-like domain-containing protein [Bifidobacterium margollesii]